MRPPESEPHGRGRAFWLAAALAALAVVLGALWLISSSELPSAGPAPETAPAVASAASGPVAPGADVGAQRADATAQSMHTTARSADTTAGSTTTARSADTTAQSADTTAQSADTTAQSAVAPAQTTSIQGDDFKLTIERAPPRRPRTRAKPAPAAASAKPRAVPQGDARVHVVVRGDTLWAIARRYLGNPFRYPELVRYSGIKNPDLIHPGDIVRIEVRNAKR